MDLQKLILATALSVAMAGGATAATLTVTEGNGNNRAEVAGSVNLGDAPSGTPAFDLNALNGGAFGAGDTIQIHGRIVSATDVFSYSFEAGTAFNLMFDFDGYDLTNGGTVAAGLSGLMNQNVVEGGLDPATNGSGKEITIALIDSMGGVMSMDFTTNVFSTTEADGDIFTNVAAGSYTLVVDGSSPRAQSNTPALYDLKVAAIPLPAPALLLLAGLGGLAMTRRRKAA